MLEKLSKTTLSLFSALVAFTPKKISLLLVIFFVTLFTLENVLDLVPVLRQSRLFSQLSWLRNLDYDFHLKRIPERQASRDIVIVEINEPSLKALGRFPFSRSVYVKLVERLNEAGASVLVFDIVFAEKEQESVLQHLQSLSAMAAENSSLRSTIEEKIRAIDGDGALLSAVQASKMPIVLGYTFEHLQQRELSQADAKFAGVPPAPEQLRLMNSLGSIRKSGLTQTEPVDAYHGIGPVLPIERYTVENLRGSPVSLGGFNAALDEDGVIRKAPIVTHYQNVLFTGLSVKALQAYWKSEAAVKKVNGNYAVEFQNGSRIPFDRFGNLPLKFYGKGRNFVYKELADVLEGKFAPHELKNKMVFLGVTAIGLKDLRTTPTAPDYPGVEIHATLASNVLQNDFLLRTEDYYIVGYLLLSLFAYALSLLLFRLHPGAGFAITGVAIAGIQFSGQEFFFNRGLIVPTILPSIQLSCIFVSALLYRYLSTEKEKKFVREAFGRYVSGAVVEEMLKDQSKLKLGGQKRVMTVLFTDMVGFTKLSEGLDAALLSQLLNEFFTAMTKVILDNKGTLDKYMGDAIMCFWGAPLESKRHASRACKAALEMQEELLRINTKWQKQYGFTVGMRVGINTGEMSVGNMGSEQVFSYTVLGDNVNLGSRLEGVNNLYGTKIIVGAETCAAAKEKFFFRELDIVAVKGKEQAVQIFELVGPNPQPQDVLDWADAFSHARALYQQQSWEEARNAFKLCLTMNAQDKASETFLSRIDELEKNSPKDWEGVWKLTSK